MAGTGHCDFPVIGGGRGVHCACRRGTFQYDRSLRPGRESSVGTLDGVDGDAGSGGGAWPGPLGARSSGVLGYGNGPALDFGGRRIHCTDRWFSEPRKGPRPVGSASARDGVSLAAALAGKTFCCKVSTADCHMD